MEDGAFLVLFFFCASFSLLMSPLSSMMNEVVALATLGGDGRGDGRGEGRGVDGVFGAALAEVMLLTMTLGGGCGR